MGASKVKHVLTIEVESEAQVEIAHLQYLVGFALTRWHFVEQDLTMAYLFLTCPKNSPVDGALTTFTNIQTVDAKINCLRKVLDQVLYQDELKDFRKSAREKLNRIQKLNELRNKLAHGMATNVAQEDGQEVPRFLPFYNIPTHHREMALTSRRWHTSVIKRQEQWDIEKTREVVESLSEGFDVAGALVRELLELFEVREATLLDAGRMTLDHGLPCDATHSEGDGRSINITVDYDWGSYG